MLLNPLLIPTLLLAIPCYGFGMFLQRKTASTAHRLVLVAASLLLSVPALLYATYSLHLFDGLAWFYNFRALAYTELAAALLGVLVGVIHEWFQPETWGERLAIPFALLALLLLPHLKPILSPVNLLGMQNDCIGDVCLQSTPSSCGPASAASLLRNRGQMASERELARESLTSTTGTENWYLARALRKRGVPAQVKILSAANEAILSPSIAGVKIGGNSGHFIAILDQTPTHVTIVDPLHGKIIYEKEALKRKYRFTGFFLHLLPSS
ncbi:cysteine peptidase family C39 domain-containing protein [Bryobacter aggregatus]|uniref:cysteine peptidase family C39 domain-containing protein n=1 Tax=Bryobacter aggregatus TaxID=360054 RepID=UPI0004E0EA98|nr:cysteine peptidase family C39 domain-containing protein [Bryobacter aggregatus]